MFIQSLAAGWLAFAASTAIAQDVEVDPGDGYVEPAPDKGPADNGREPVCTLTVEQTDKAVAAFSRMMPALADPRCANCHGGVNPYAENGGHAGGQIKLESIADRWLRDPGALKAALGSPKPAEVAAAQTALRTVISAKGENLSAETIADILNAGGLEEAVAASACSSCHAHTPVSWRAARSPFAGRSQKQLCKAFQKHPDVTSPAEFVDHISRDPLAFIPVAFTGTRALTPFGQAFLKAETGRDYAPEPVKGATQTSLNRAAFDWASLLGEKYRQPASCGCEKLSYALAIEAAFDVDYAGGGGFAVVAQRHAFRLPMVFTEEGRFEAKGTTALETSVDSGGGGGECKVVQPVEEDWALKGAIDAETREMKLGGTVVTRRLPAVVVCRVDGKIVRQPMPATSVGDDIEQYNLAMPAYVDEPSDFSFSVPYGVLKLNMRIVRD